MVLHTRHMNSESKGFILDASVRGIGITSMMYLMTAYLDIATALADEDGYLPTLRIKADGILALSSSVNGAIQMLAIPILGSIVDYTPYRWEICFYSLLFGYACNILVFFTLHHYEWFYVHILLGFPNGVMFQMHLITILAYLPELTHSKQDRSDINARSNLVVHAVQVIAIAGITIMSFLVSVPNNCFLSEIASCTESLDEGVCIYDNATTSNSTMQNRFLTAAETNETLIIESKNCSDTMMVIYDSVGTARISIAAALAYGLVTSCYIYLKLMGRRPAMQTKDPGVNLVKTGFNALFATFRGLRHEHRVTTWFLVTYMMAQASMHSFIPIAMTTMNNHLDMKGVEVMMVIGTVLVSAVPFSLLVGRFVTNKVGSR